MMAPRRNAEVEDRSHAGRVALAPLDPSFAKILFPLINDWQVVRMLSEVPWPIAYEDVESFLRARHAASDEFAILAGSDEGGRAPIGVCAVKKPGSGNPPRQMPRLGYWIGRPYWGRGLGTAAVAELVERAFRLHPHPRVGAGVFRENLASLRVLEKLGFAAVGSKTVESRSRGGPVEAIDMQITRAAWEGAKARAS